MDSKRRFRISFDNGDGTVFDNNTPLMWQKDPGKKKTYTEAVAGAADFRLAGYKDWRFPTIKELHPLIMFSGIDPNPRSMDPSRFKTFIDSKYFDFVYGDPSKNERIIHSQYLSSTKYVSFTMHRDETIFGVNFAGGRIRAILETIPGFRGKARMPRAVHGDDWDTKVWGRGL